MHQALNRNLYLVKEHVGMFKAASNYDIHDPETGEVIMQCREERLGMVTKLLRFTDFKRMTAFDSVVRTPDGRQVVRVSRGMSLFLSKVQVFNDRDEVIGGFKQKLWSIGGAFRVLDAQDEPVCDLKGKWTGWDFRFMRDDFEFAHVSKKWSGLGKEMFTSADNYMLQISEDVPPDHPVRPLIMGAVLCIDLVLKE